MLSDEHTGAETDNIRLITIKYLDAVQDLLEEAGESCELPRQILSMSNNLKYENINVYLKKLVYRYYELLNGDLKELARMLGRNAINHAEFKQGADSILERFEQTDDKVFPNKKFVDQKDIIKKNFALLDEQAEEKRKELYATKKDAASPKKEGKWDDAKASQRSPFGDSQSPGRGQKGATQSSKKNQPAEGEKNQDSDDTPGLESSGKGGKSQPERARESSKDGGVQALTNKPPVGRQDKKYPETTITVISKHHPRSNVSYAYKWKPNESMLMNRIKKQQKHLEDELRGLDEREEAEKERKRKEEMEKWKQKKKGKKAGELEIRGYRQGRDPDSSDAEESSRR